MPRTHRDSRENPGEYSGDLAVSLGEEHLVEVAAIQAIPARSRLLDRRR